MNKYCLRHGAYCLVLVCIQIIDLYCDSWTMIAMRLQLQFWGKCFTQQIVINKQFSTVIYFITTYMDMENL